VAGGCDAKYLVGSIGPSGTAEDRIALRRRLLEGPNAGNPVLRSGWDRTLKQEAIINAEARTSWTRRLRIDGPWSVASASSLLAVFCLVLATLALFDLAIRSAVDLDLSWDTFAYHLPFAALRGGLPISYDMSDLVRPRFDGFPPLPELVEGLLWRATGSVNATGVVNAAAFGTFLIWSHRQFRAPFWLVALLSLTAPLVLIHTTVSYVDLFGNALLAIGLCSCLYVFLFPDMPARRVLAGGFIALAAAAWSKYQLVPVVALGFILLSALVVWPSSSDRFNRRQGLTLILVFGVLAAAPYLKNMAVYGNPFWPERAPIVGGLFPYLDDGSTGGAASQRPASLVGTPQPVVFIKSLFEIDVPRVYTNRPRWDIDQGSVPTTSGGFRMGGFWGVNVAVCLVVAVGMLVALGRRRGVVASIAGAVLIALISILPQSNELRYYLFIPLVWSATIGMLYTQLRDRAPRISLGLLVLVLALFGYMVSENWSYYSIKPVGYRDAAIWWGAADWWPRLRTGPTYCAVGLFPIGILMTGPSMSEFSIVDRSQASLCPPRTIEVTTAGIQAP
jgi:hypothetical protein